MLPSLKANWSALLSNPFEAISREALERLPMPASPFGPIAWWEGDGQYVVEMDVPGVRIEDLDISVDKGHLIIRGERRAPETSQKSWYDERSFGTFQKVVRLDESADPGSIDATLTDGVLRLTVGKRPEHRPQRVPVKAEQPKRLSTE